MASGRHLIKVQGETDGVLCSGGSFKVGSFGKGGGGVGEGGTPVGLSCLISASIRSGEKGCAGTASGAEHAANAEASDRESAEREETERGRKWPEVTTGSGSGRIKKGAESEIVNRTMMATSHRRGSMPGSKSDGLGVGGFLRRRTIEAWLTIAVSLFHRSPGLS